MRIVYFLIVLLCFSGCSDDEMETLLPNVPVDVTVNLNLPQFIDLQTPTGFAYTTGGVKGILIHNQGVGTPPYKAFDRACPNNDCASPMEFDGSLKMTCPCEEISYSIIDGSPQSSGGKYFAREYKVTMVNASTIHISNF